MGPGGCQLCQMEGVAEPSPEGQKDAPPRGTADGQPAATQAPAAADAGSQRGTKLGGTLKGILGRKHGG